MLPYVLTGNQGLFIRKIEYQGLESGIGKMGNIPVLPSELSIDSLTVSTVIPDDFSEATYDISYHMTGYRAYYFQEAYSSAEDNKKEEAALPYVKIISDDSDVEGLKVENADEPANFFLKPVSVSAKAKTNAPVEKAGDKILYNIGKLIGEQSHLYDDVKRKQPIEIEYQHQFFRVLTVEIPEGCRITNPDILNMDVNYTRDGKSMASFKSTYEIIGRKVIVKVLEKYDLIQAPLEDYEVFKKVINAAADFNKLTLIIEREG
jgi:hypothetical protein